MRDAIADRDRWLALAILAGVVALAYLVLVHPWWTAPMLELNTRIEGLQQRELRARMQLQQAPEVRKRLEAVRAQAARMPGFMNEATPELATAALVQRLETAVQEASPGNRSCAITNRSPTEETRQDRFRRVVVNVRLRCGSPELAAVLHSLESGSPRLFADNLNVLAQRFYFSAAQGQQNGGLDVSFDLFGYLPPSAATSAATETARAP